ncbi:hypothetical protein AVI51_00660 [Piscirickettsia salmonis]|uniref:hypothetical protein n=1 Tax=Piscirickettsia salmonis TaxID=1238 RepID=UPI0003186B5F|nr:hypothetical protein [Piscirickettsia salmonis]ALA24563.1 phage infection protein [Piscirickettsia salmonis]APS44911.1 hypothetical protein AVI48_11390 [Piscirickettsia salmonis]APS48273.1 hypothetical protein AVI49_12000 [Piscirickettsia salmonis]APS49534.1 hypothetical protein AVI50_00685 [Piscirickettsia salmonis]APS52715.1 hypothetical protein AVI51_00660 [Piscirickettsia salmonis]
MARQRKKLNHEQINYISRLIARLCDGGLAGAVKMAEDVNPGCDAREVRKLFYKISSYSYCSWPKQKNEGLLSIKDGDELQSWLEQYFTSKYYQRLMASFRQNKFHQQRRLVTQRVYGVSKLVADYSKNKAKEKTLGTTQGEVISKIVETFILLEETVARMNQERVNLVPFSVIDLVEAMPNLCQLEDLAQKSGESATEFLKKLSNESQVEEKV